MLVKWISPGSQDFHEPVAQMIKLSSRGLIGHDRHVLVKRAGAEFAHHFDQVKFAADEIPIHLLAIGATEFYGPNRNADGFTCDTCRRKHKTFEKYAKFYRDHINKDPARSYGHVKLSAWHEPMKRIELLCALNAAQSAADRNGGFVADREMDKLANQQDIAVSMACRVPNDVCSGCGNRARTRDEYCDSIENGGTCKEGGLKHNLGRLLKSGHILHADNPDPTFFDISHVFRPADRIAFVMGRLEKAASTGRVHSGAEMAEMLGISVPYTLLIPQHTLPATAAQYKLAYQLADLERGPLPSTPWAPAFTEAVRADMSLPVAKREKFAQILRALADERIVLPTMQFIRLVTDASEKQAAEVAAAVDAYLPGVFDRLTKAADFDTLVEQNPYTPAEFTSAELRLWAQKCAADLSIATHHVERRLQLAAIRRVTVPGLSSSSQAEKLAAAGGPAAEMAKQYALYKLAFLTAVHDTTIDLPLTASFIVLQNYVH